MLVAAKLGQFAREYADVILDISTDDGPLDFDEGRFVRPDLRVLPLPVESPAPLGRGELRDAHRRGAPSHSRHATQNHSRVLYRQVRVRCGAVRRLTKLGQIPVTDRGTLGGLSQSVSQFGFAGSSTSL
jgi:hypothetical protein